MYLISNQKFLIQNMSSIIFPSEDNKGGGGGGGWLTWAVVYGKG